MARAVAPVAFAILLVAVLAPAQAYSYQCVSTTFFCQLAPPMAFTARTMPDGIHLEWQPPVDGSVDAYVVHRIAADDGDEQVFDAGLGLSLVDQPAEPGTYVYYVTAKHGADASVPSNPFLARWPHCQPVTLHGSSSSPEIEFDCFEPLPLAGTGQ